MVRRCGLFCALISLVFFSYGYAETGLVQLPEGLVLKPFAYGHFEFGQIPRGSLNSLTNKSVGADSMIINHGWVEDQLATIGLDAVYKEHLEIKICLLTQLYFSYPFVDLANSRMTKNSTQAVAIDDAYAQIYYGNADAPFIRGQVGFFKYKYNPDARNLGEYLFRTGTYPIVFSMGFDFPQARLLGLRLETNGGGINKRLDGLKLEGLLTSATLPPTMVWSAAAIAKYDILNRHFIDIGAGIDFSNVLNVYNNQTYPTYIGYDKEGDPVTPRYGNARYISDIQIDDLGNLDTVYGYYTFAGTKIMGRISIDPKFLLPKKFTIFGKTFAFGENDLKFYAEADIIGLKSYPDSGFANADSRTLELVAPSYNNWKEKMPVALGINVPTFKVLDVLNIEMEYFGAEYYNDATALTSMGSNPLPYDWQGKMSDSPTYKKSKWKWSAYAKRTFFDGHFGVVIQVARDHLMLASASYDYQDQAETLVTSKDWWWAFKTSWMF
jgi:hypothetical protein